MRDFVNRHVPLLFGVLAALVVLSLGLNLVLLGRAGRTERDLERVEGGAALFAAQVTGFQNQLAAVGPTVGDALDQAVMGLDTFRTSTLSFDVTIDETIPIDATIDLTRTLDVPISTVLPIDESFDTRIVVDGPWGLDVPLNVTVPIRLDLPIDLQVQIPIDEQIPVRTEVPVHLDVPISVDVAETELAALVAALQQGLEAFGDVLTGLGG
jgi:hypothetical protein